MVLGDAISPLTPEPAPTVGTGDMWAQIIACLSPDDPLLPHCVERRQQGIDRYGVPLQTGNGRNVARDLFQEQMDSIAYAEQWLSSIDNADPKAADEIETAMLIRWDSMNNARRLLGFIK